MGEAYQSLRHRGAYDPTQRRRTTCGSDWKWLVCLVSTMMLEKPRNSVTAVCIDMLATIPLSNASILFKHSDIALPIISGYGMYSSQQPLTSIRGSHQVMARQTYRSVWLSDNGPQNHPKRQNSRALDGWMCFITAECESDGFAPLASGSDHISKYQRLTNWAK